MSSSRRARTAANPLQPAKPRPTVRRVGSGGAGSSSGGVVVSSGAAAAAANANASGSDDAAPRASKLRANRERRRRELSMDEDDLDNKFSNLSVSAPSFTPSSLRASPSSGGSTVAAPTASWLAKAKPPQRRVPPAHQRQQKQQQQQPTVIQAPATPVPKAPTPMSQWSSSTAKAAASGKARAPVEPPSVLANGRTPVATASTAPLPVAGDRRLRRQRIGTLGFARSGMSMNRRTPQSGPAASPATSSSSSPFNTSFQLGGKPPTTSAASVVEAAAPSVGAQRKRSDSAGSEADYGSDDDAHPDTSLPVGVQAPSAFPERLMLLSQQKKVPMSVVSRDAVIDTVFSALFAKKDKTRGDSARRFSAFGDDTSGTETDEPNEDFVKRGLAASLFKDSLSGVTIQLERRRGGMTDQEAVERFITPSFVHTLVNDMRFEDFRTASSRIDILRAIHKSCPTKRVHIARALADATTLRLQYVQALLATAQAREVEKQRVMAKHPNDHGHGFTDLLRYAIEHVGESLNGITGESADASLISQREVDEIVRNYLLALISLWKTHWSDPAGSDDEELISCAGQFVAYIPRVALGLMHRLVVHWPSRFPAMEVIAIRMMARVVMTSPPLHTLEDPPRLPLKVFARLAKCVRSPHTQVAQEALAFTGCQFAMVHFLGQYDEIYQVVSEAFHQNAREHWNDVIRTTSEGHFDRALDYAP